MFWIAETYLEEKFIKTDNFTKSDPVFNARTLNLDQKVVLHYQGVQV